MKKVIIAPLNWGLGHATRCIPIIIALQENGFTPILASDGKALELLKQEFPNLESIQLPSYNISYGKNLRWNLLLQVPKIKKAVAKEQQLIEQYTTENTDVVGIISDNRFGVRSTKVASIYVTHQVNVLSGATTFFTSKIHQNIIKKFDECWIPDNLNSEFSGELSLFQNNKTNAKFIGVLSRFQPKKITKNIDVLAIASGVEPNRTSLENKLISELSNYNGNVVLIQGKVDEQQTVSEKNGIKIYNFVLSKKLENLINSAKLVICRSGYSSIMDLAVLQKKAVFIPTKNQTEQEYLARFLASKKLAPFTSEANFNIKILEKVSDYKGLSSEETVINPELFRLFERKRKL